MEGNTIPKHSSLIPKHSSLFQLLRPILAANQPFWLERQKQVCSNQNNLSLRFFFLFFSVLFFSVLFFSFSFCSLVIPPSKWVFSSYFMIITRIPLKLEEKLKIPNIIPFNSPSTGKAGKRKRRRRALRPSAEEVPAVAEPASILRHPALY